MFLEKAPALLECDRMGIGAPNGAERNSRRSDQVMDNPHAGLKQDGQAVLQQKIVVFMDGACQSVFNPPTVSPAKSWERTKSGLLCSACAPGGS